MDTIHTEEYKGYTINIAPDDDPMNPRKEFDEASHFICWHGRYDLGDKHNYSDTSEFINALGRQLASEKISKLEQTRDNKVEEVYQRYYRKVERVGYNGISSNDMSMRDAAEEQIKDDYDARIEDTIKKAIESDCIMLDLYLYDHSGITISASDFGDSWDSRQVGFAYMTKAEVIKEYGAWNKGTKAQARKLILSEVENYDDYLTGNVYGYQILDQNDEVVDSCWGFYGDYNKYCLEEARNAVDYLAKERDARIAKNEQSLTHLKQVWHLA